MIQAQYKDYEGRRLEGNRSSEEGVNLEGSLPQSFIELFRGSNYRS